MKKLLFMAFIWIFEAATAQPSIQWQKTFGGSDNEDARCVQQTRDGGYVMIGFALSNNGDVMGNHGGGDFWVLKLDSTGTVQWKRTYGGTDLDVGYYIQQCTDGGYIMAGTVFSNNGDVTGHHDEDDAWVVKLDSLGDIQWQRALGGNYWDEARCVQQTFDGGYIMAGFSNSLDGDVTGNHGALDFWVVKLSPDGDILWQKSLGGSNNDLARAIKGTNDGGYLVTGETLSNNGQVSGNNGNTDYWVVKMNGMGEIEWQNTLGGIGSDIAHGVAQSQDGGYYILGASGSGNSGDVMGNHGLHDIWLVKLNNLGGIQWSLALGGSEPDYGFSISNTNDNGCVIVGSTQSHDGDVQGNDGGAELWVVKLDKAGALQWQKTLGGTQAEQGNTIRQTSDGGFITAGFTWSNNGDVTDNSGGKDLWIVKLHPESTPTKSPKAQPLEIYPNPTTQSINLQIPEPKNTLSVSITDLLGRELSRQSIPNGGTMELKGLADGLYWVSATTGSGKVFVGKVLKQE
jgi:hypothetical protein